MIKVQSTRKRIERCIELHMAMKYSYFWKPPARAAERRSFERMRCDLFTFKHAGMKYVVDQTTRCTCQNVHYKLLVLVDGKKKDVRILKKLIRYNHHRDLEQMQRKLLYSVNSKNYQTHKQTRKRKYQNSLSRRYQRPAPFI